MSMRPFAVAAAILSTFLAGCVERAADSGATEERPVLEVTALYDATSNRHYFETSTDTLNAGWTTIRFTNASPMAHFVFLDHLPGERTSDDLLSEVSPHFQESMDLIAEGKPEEAATPFERLPEWFGELTFRGGPGLTSPGLTTETTLFMEPGNYVLECYVKTAEGIFHWNRGMFADLHVTHDTTEAGPPRNPTLQVTVTDSALILEGDPTPGDHVVAVYFQEREPGFLGKDVHLVRLDSESDIDGIVAWMDVNRVDGMVSTAEDPAPATFLGGVHELPFGSRAYFTVTLEPGDYLLVSEQPTAESLFRKFTVS